MAFKLFSGRKNKSRDRPARTESVMPLWNIMTSLAKGNLKNSEAIYSAVSQIGNVIACLPLHLYKDYEIQRDDPRERCVAYAPNATMTPYNLKLAVESCRDTTGTGYIMIVPRADQSGVDRLDPLTPERVTVCRSSEDGDIWYRVRLDDGREATVHNSYIIALHHMSTDGIMGISPIEVLSGTLSYDRKIQEISLTQLETSGDSILLTYPTTISGDKRKEHITAFLDAYKASKGQVIILDGGITAERMQGSRIDAKALDVANITTRKVASVYNLPPRMLGDAAAAGYSTSEQDVAEFIKRTIIPIVRQWEECLNRKLLTYEEFCAGYSFRFDLDALKRGDVAAMAEKHAKAVRSGIMTANEARREDGLPPMPDGDQLLVSRDLIPVNVLIRHPELLLAGRTSDKK